MPRDVLREAVLNAVVHRVYSTGNPIHIKIYDDRVVIYNSCRLSANMVNGNLLSSGRSNPHNPLIAGAFFRSGQIEAWGRGINKMKKGCIADGLPEPEFDITPVMFTVCFHIRNNNMAAKELENHNGYRDDFGINFGINESKRKILKILAEQPTATLQVVANELGMTKRNVEVHVSQLKRSGHLERVGSRKNGRWLVKKH